ncbi:hypothetical protein BH09ACT6_BH09ACT6_03490 [soil metagenome]
MSEDDADEVTRLERLRAELLLAGDVDGINELCHDDLIFTHSVGFRDTKETLLASLRTGVLRYHAIEQDIDHVIVADGAVAIIGSQPAELAGGGQRITSRSFTSALWVPHSGRWTLRAFQGTVRATGAAEAVH